jgi:ribose transport system ATP-binding protein
MTGDGVDREVPLLVMRDVSKAFGAQKALDGVSFTLMAGEVHALIGENGAGKSTLMKVLSGVHRPDSGSMTLAGAPYAPSHPRMARRRGVAMIYQELTIAPHLTVEANVLLGRERTRLGLIRRREHRRLTREAMAVLEHADIRPDAVAGGLSVGAQQLIEVARALVSDASVIVFDEPTSSLTEQDSERLFEVITRLRERGLGIVYISHFLEEVRRVAQRYTVLRDGRSVATGVMEGTPLNTIVSHMVGRDLDDLFPRVAHTPGEPVLELDAVSGRSLPRGASLTLRRGEVMGIAGLVGAGRTELMRAIFGLDRVRSGRVRVARIESTAARPRRKIRQGVGFLSEDRKAEGLALERSIEDNLTYSALGRHARMGWLNRGRQRAAALDGRAEGPRAGAVSAGRGALGRQSAEGRPGEAAAPGGRRAAARRADARHRRRLQGRDLPPHRRAGGAGQGGADGQLLSPGVDGRLRPDRGHDARHAEPGPAGRRVERADDHGSRDRRIESIKRKHLEDPSMIRTSTFLAFLAIAITARVQAQDNKPTGRIDRKDVVYTTVDGQDLRLDIMAPAGEGPFPVIVTIHGGAWLAGDKASNRPLMERLVAAGYVAVSPQYRFCPKVIFPAQVHDVKAAVRWARSHAEELRADPDHIGAVGFSAGGHLSLMLGVTDGDDGLEGEIPADAPSSRVQAVVNYFGPTDMAADDIPAVSKPLLRDFLGGEPKEKPEAAKDASPLTFVTKDDPPTLTYQGTKDPLVPHTQAVKLADAQTAAGAPGRVELLIGAGHGWGGDELDRTIAGTIAFFDQNLKNAKKD